MNEMDNFSVEKVQQLLQNAIPNDLFVDGANGKIERYHIYTPDAHSSALNPQTMLVEGMRGTGKSFWWSILLDKEYRNLVQTFLPKTALANTECIAGFGSKKLDNYPSSSVLQKLQEDFDSFHIWYGIVVRNLLGEQLSLPPKEAWGQTIEWIKNNLEHVENELLNKDKSLSEKNQMQLILFDALDQTAQNWKALRTLLKGLLRLLLEFRGYQSIRLKAFIRPDMLSDKDVLAFPDSSKILQNKVNLDWKRTDLYGLLWQYLGNESTQGQHFRETCEKLLKQKWNQKLDIWVMPKEMKSDEKCQREIFHELVGPYMGSNAKRGYPYTWLPNHLGDSYGKVSPRSFLAVLKEACDDRKEYKYPIHYESIKKGVQKASSIRVNELSEDYPWVSNYLEPLKGLSLPCHFSTIQEKWEQKDLPKKDTTDTDLRDLPARHKDGVMGVKKDLIDLGIFQEMKDQRINMPDVYRVGYGLGRKGGVKPVR